VGGVFRLCELHQISLSSAVAIKFALSSTQAFEDDDEEDDADAGASEHAGGGYAPGLGDEACGSVSIEWVEYSVNVQASIVFQFQVILILQPPMLMAIGSAAEDGMLMAILLVGVEEGMLMLMAMLLEANEEVMAMVEDGIDIDIDMSTFTASN
jgi:hypothetical protein